MRDDVYKGAEEAAKVDEAAKVHEAAEAAAKVAAADACETKEEVEKRHDRLFSYTKMDETKGTRPTLRRTRSSCCMQ